MLFVCPIRLHQHCREPSAVYERAEAAIALCTEQEFAFYLAWGITMQGWALVMQGQWEDGIDRMCQGQMAWRDTGAKLLEPYGLALMAEVYGHEGQSEEGLQVLAEALAIASRTEERFHEAELHRLKGELLLQLSPDNHTEAETCFHHALSIARNQQAKSWELRAATSLARLWQSQDKHKDAYNLLAPVYGWFTEGFDTADLKDARALLDELS